MKTNKTELPPCWLMIATLLSAAVISAYSQLPTPVSDQILSVPQANSHAQGTVTGFPSGSFTVEGYVYFPNYPPSYECTLLRKEGFCDVTIRNYSQTTFPYDTYYEFFFGVATGTPGQFRGPGYDKPYYLIRNGWHHVALSYDSSSDTKHIFLDGTLLSPSFTSTLTYTTPPSTDVVVGGVSTSTNALGYHVDELRVSSGVRYSGSFTPPSSAFSPDGTTAGLWHFDDGQGATTFADSSANGNTLLGYNGAIVNATPTVQWTVASQSCIEDVGTVTVTAQLSAASGLAVKVPFTIDAASTASNPDDYTITPSPITISAGATTNSATITVFPDDLDENEETVILNMGTPTNATLGTTTVHTATITDNDNEPEADYDAWTAAKGLTGGDALPLADPDGDGTPNQIECAFNLDPTDGGMHVLDPLNPLAGGLPLWTTTDSGDLLQLQVQFLRRKRDTLMSYVVQFAASPGGPWGDAADLGTVTPVDADWEIVTVVDQQTPPTPARRFGCVKVVYTP